VLGRLVTTVAVVQARMGSTRLPGKVMRPVHGVPMIERLLDRLSRAGRIQTVVVATSSDPVNAPLVAHVRRLGFACHQGSEHDVLERVVQVAEAHAADRVVRVTGDCPLIDPRIVDEAVAVFERAGVDYLSNLAPPTYPDGLDTEVFTFPALVRAHREATRAYDREHVTPYLRESGRFRTANLAHGEDWSGERWTVDRPEDVCVLERVFRHFDPRVDFSWLEVLALSRTQPELFDANRHLTRNHGTASSRERAPDRGTVSAGLGPGAPDSRPDGDERAE
jgi:glutamate-1-semialdehyde 2,1-aminomutase